MRAPSVGLTVPNRLACTMVSSGSGLHEHAGIIDAAPYSIFCGNLDQSLLLAGAVSTHDMYGDVVRVKTISAKSDKLGTSWNHPQYSPKRASNHKPSCLSDASAVPGRADQLGGSEGNSAAIATADSAAEGVHDASCKPKVDKTHACLKQTQQLHHSRADGMY